MNTRLGRAVLAAAALILAAGPALQAGASPSTFPGENGRIAFTELQYCGFFCFLLEVHTVAPDGTDEQELTVAEEGAAGAPSWSPDGALLTYSTIDARIDNPYGRVWVMNADGSGQHDISLEPDPQVGEWLSSWSRDGSQVVYIKRDCRVLPCDGTDIWVMDADGGNEHEVADLDGVGRVSWSPTADKLLYDQEVAPDLREIHVLDLDTGVDETIVAGGISAQPGWSPDGNQVVYEVRADQYAASGEIWIVNADGSEPRFVAGGAGDRLAQPAFSPDGTRIAASVIDPKPTIGLVTMRTDGSDRRIVLEGGERVLQLADWQAINR
ncbi:MAG: TolB family protein [Actinomycetota bacterium]